MRDAIHSLVYPALALALAGCKVEVHPPVEAAVSGKVADISSMSIGPAPSASASPVPLVAVASSRVAQPVPKYEPGPTSAALCEDFVRRARRHDATLPIVGDFGGGGFPVSTFDTACFPTPKGAWALEVGTVHASAAVRDGKSVNERLEGSYHAVHFDESGRVDGPPVPFVASEWESFTLDQELFDYDRDGEPELLLHIQTTEHTAAGTSSELVFTAGDGAVRRYAAAAVLPTTMSEDIDSDGRPDLLYTGEEPFRIAGTSDTRHTSMILEVLFAAHALPDGHFSARDAAAVAYVRTQCPGVPQSIVARSFGSIDEEASVKNVHCARVWGISTAEIKAQIARDCVPPKSQDRGRGGSRTCANYDMMMTWAEFVPPVQLADSGP